MFQIDSVHFDIGLVIILANILLYKLLLKKYIYVFNFLIQFLLFFLLVSSIIFTFNEKIKRKHNYFEVISIKMLFFFAE